MINEINNCGLVSLKNICSLKDISIRTLINIAEDNGLNLYPYKVSKGNIDLIELPAILHFKNHFSYITDRNYLDKTDFTGEFLLTKKANYEEIIGEDLKNIKGATMAWIGVGGLAIGATSKIVNYFQAEQNKTDAKNKLGELQNQPLPQYSVSPELAKYHSLNLSGVNNPQGLSEGEKSAFNQNVTNNVNTQMYNATNTAGGNLAKYIHNALNPASVSSSNQLVGQDQQIKRANYNAALGRLGQSTSAIQGIGDRNINNAFNRRTMIEQGLGGAISQNNRYQMESLDSLGNDLIGAGTQLGLGALKRGTGGSGSSGSSDGLGIDGTTTGAGGENYSLSNRVKLGGSY